MIKRDGIFLITVLTALTLCAPSLCLADKGSQFGVMWGLSVPDAQNTNVFKVFAVKGESFIAPMFSLGGYIVQSDRSGQLSQSEKFCYSLTGIEAAYHIPNAQGDTFVGFRMGMTKLQQNPSAQDVTFSPYHYGIATGYDYYITSMFSIGFEGSYTHVLPGRTDLNGVTYEQPSFNLMNFLISVQLRL
ncbi:MAG: hypothetical protein ACXVA9_11830 [Bdellovibrionales bacterium]